MSNSKDLEPSIIVCCVLKCDVCGKEGTYEGTKEDKPYAAEYFFGDGWRNVDGLIYCPKHEVK